MAPVTRRSTQRQTTVSRDTPSSSISKTLKTTGTKNKSKSSSTISPSRSHKARPTPKSEKQKQPRIDLSLQVTKKASRQRHQKTDEDVIKAVGISRNFEDSKSVVDVEASETDSTTIARTPRSEPDSSSSLSTPLITKTPGSKTASNLSTPSFANSIIDDDVSTYSTQESSILSTKSTVGTDTIQGTIGTRSSPASSSYRSFPTSPLQSQSLDLSFTCSKRSAEDEEKLLRDFDLNSIYGACRGLSRYERYARAVQYKLKPRPSEEIGEILRARSGDKFFDTCLWDKNTLLGTARTK